MRDGALVVPTRRMLWREYAQRLTNGPKSWLPFWGWFSTLVLGAFLVVFFARYFTWPALVAGFLYTTPLVSIYSTIYFHRFAVHRSFTIRHPFWLFVLRNATLKLLSEETYVISHHVHHAFSDQPGDPYNPKGGWLYVYFARINHQAVATDLSPSDYARLTSLLSHTGMRINTYAQYQRWGSIAHPLRTIVQFALNWAFWGAVFYAVGGMPLATSALGFGFVWTFGIRNFNFKGHHPRLDYREGVDFDRKSRALNQLLPGLAAGEWHNNHHLFPKSARTGFLPGQIDIPWWLISGAHKLGIVSSVNDQREDFLREYAPTRDALFSLS